MSTPTTKPEQVSVPVPVFVIKGQSYPGAVRDVEEDISRRLQYTLNIWKFVAYFSAVFLILHFLIFERIHSHLSFFVVGAFLGLTGLFGFFAIHKENIAMLKVYMAFITIGCVSSACLPFLLRQFYGREPLLTYWCPGSETNLSTFNCRAFLDDNLSEKTITHALWIFLELLIWSALLIRLVLIITFVNAWKDSLTSSKNDVENPLSSPNSESSSDSTDAADPNSDEEKPSPNGKEDDDASKVNNQEGSNVVVGIPVMV
eukprot:GEMP01015213.1.p1 GENE.GEMP01015213.1~~GEMP01015213.1.p1  ORF type:complete len:259 (+),score=49.38 GEMP01015213.1:79-855(+)